MDHDDLMAILHKHSLRALYVMLSYKDRRYTDVLFRRYFGHVFSKKMIEDAISAKLTETILLGAEDVGKDIVIEETDCAGNGEEDYVLNIYGT